MVFGIFGMNLNFSPIQSDFSYFLGIVIGTTLLFLLMVITFSVAIYKMKIS